MTQWHESTYCSYVMLPSFSSLSSTFLSPDLFSICSLVTFILCGLAVSSPLQCLFGNDIITSQSVSKPVPFSSSPPVRALAPGQFLSITLSHNVFMQGGGREGREREGSIPALHFFFPTSSPVHTQPSVIMFICPGI